MNKAQRETLKALLAETEAAKKVWDEAERARAAGAAREKAEARERLVSPQHKREDVLASPAWLTRRKAALDAAWEKAEARDVKRTTYAVGHATAYEAAVLAWETEEAERLKSAENAALAVAQQAHVVMRGTKAREAEMAEEDARDRPVNAKQKTAEQKLADYRKSLNPYAFLGLSIGTWTWIMATGGLVAFMAVLAWT